MHLAGEASEERRWGYADMLVRRG